MKFWTTEWMTQLDRDDHRSLAIFLCHIVSKQFSMQATEAAQLVASIVGRADKTVRRWRTGLIKNKGKLPKSKQGRFVREGVNEELAKRSVKGKPNMTTHDVGKYNGTPKSYA